MARRRIGLRDPRVESRDVLVEEARLVQFSQNKIKKKVCFSFVIKKGLIN